MSAPGRITLGDWQTLREFAAPIRVAVFVQEQGVPIELEWDEFDASSLHAVACDGAVAVGTARLLPDGHIGRMAVLPAWRGQGIGAALLASLMDAACARGLERLLLHAQCHAQAFYARAGFAPEGAPFDEAGIAHIVMTRALPAR